jgi:hypothetical protein
LSRWRAFGRCQTDPARTSTTPPSTAVPRRTTRPKNPAALTPDPVITTAPDQRAAAGRPVGPRR